MIGALMQTMHSWSLKSVGTGVFTASDSAVPVEIIIHSEFSVSVALTEGLDGLALAAKVRAAAL